MHMARLLENWPPLEIIGENEASDAKHSILRSERMQIISKKEIEALLVSSIIACCQKYRKINLVYWQ